MIRIQDPALLPKEAFYSDEWFRKEKDKIFSTFLCPATTHSLEKKNDFVVFDWWKKSLVLQRFSALISCFENYCQHRLALLQSGSGNRPLICKYHSWSYDASGRTICPVKDKSGISDLPKIETHTEGRFIFANTGKESFDGFIESEIFMNFLRTVSLNLGELIETVDIEMEANWKIVVENTLEAYHIQTVHPDTFAKAGLSSDVENSFSKSHSSMLIRESGDTKKDPIKDILKSRLLSIPGFFHLLLFPNLSIGTLFGLTTYVGHIIPVSPTKTIFRYRLFGCVTTDESSKVNMAKSIVAKSASDFTKQTLYEDKMVCESVQRGVTESGNSGVLVDSEERINHFRKNIMERMA